MATFAQQLPEEEGELFDIIEILLGDVGIAVSDIIEQEWMNTCGSMLFRAWAGDRIIEGKIRFVEPDFPAKAMETLHKKFGLPLDSRDKHLIRASSVTKLRYILSNDVDLYDPKVKNGTALQRHEAREKRQGALYLHLLEAHDIQVGTPAHCLLDLYGT